MAGTAVLQQRDQRTAVPEAVGWPVDSAAQDHQPSVQDQIPRQW